MAADGWHPDSAAYCMDAISDEQAAYCTDAISDEQAAYCTDAQVADTRADTRTAACPAEPRCAPPCHGVHCRVHVSKKGAQSRLFDGRGVESAAPWSMGIKGRGVLLPAGAAALL
jgi:hypothetical protein